MNFENMITRPWFALAVTTSLAQVVIVSQSQAQSEEWRNYPKIDVTLYRDLAGQDDLVIYAPTAHRYALAITTPSNKGGIVFDPSFNIDPNNMQDFGISGEYKIDTNALKSWRFIDDKIIIEPVFTEPGLYCLHFSSNLETEIENTFFQISGIYWPSEEPVQNAQFFDDCIKRLRE